MNEKEELYGVERLKNYWNQHVVADIEETLKGLRESIDEFAEGEQSDDITMLLMHYKKQKKKV